MKRSPEGSIGRRRIGRDAKCRLPGIRGFIYWWLENKHNPNKWKLDAFLVFVILVSVIVIIAQVSILPEANPVLDALDLVCLGIFILEYLGRFLVNTDFIADVREKGIGEAARNKLLWMLRPMSIVDAVALVPTTRALRTMRLFRLLRIARLLRVLKMARYTSGLSGYVEEFRKKSTEFLVLVATTFGILIFAAITLFCVERPAGNEQIDTVVDAFWWALVTLTTVGYGDTYPVTTAGRIIAGLLMLTSIGIVGAIGGLAASILVERAANLRLGREKLTKMEGHILFCGWTPCAEKVAQILNDEGLFDKRRLVLLTSAESPDKDYVHYHRGSVASQEDLRAVRADRAGIAVVFHDAMRFRSAAAADRMASMAAFHIAMINPECHIVVELSDESHAELILDNVPSAEIVLREAFDAEVVLNTIRNAGHTSLMLRDLCSLTHNKVTAHKLEDVTDWDMARPTVRDVKKHLIDTTDRAILLGYMRPGGDPLLNPASDVALDPQDTVYLLEGDPNA